MNNTYIAILAILCGTFSVANAQSQQAFYQPIGSQLNTVAQVSCCDSPVCGCEAVGCATAPTCGIDSGCIGGPACGCESAPAPTCGADMGCASEPCGCATAPNCGCDVGCAISPACDIGNGCDSACGGGCPLGGGGCDLGDPFALFGTTGCGVAAGGWLQIGYHDKALPLFNAHPDRVNVHQAWLYAEKAADGSNGLGLGGRIDYVYGVDAQDTQAFGINNDHWDNGWDNGIYGHAIPQLYAEAAYGNMSVKLGHFYTIIGWEVVTAPDNFFYSHAYTMYNSEPFTHTGALATLTPNDDLTIYGGYVFGWDSGFEDNGDAFLGGVSMTLSDDVSITYATIGGKFAEQNGVVGEEGYMHSLIADVALTDNLQYIIQSDLLDSNNAADETVRDTVGINNYLIYTVNDCLAFGGRFEWWNVDARSQGFYGPNAPAGLVNTAGGDYDITALTLGLNYRPHANVIVRPEIRWDWVEGDQASLALADISFLEDNDSQSTFGIDTIFLF